MNGAVYVLDGGIQKVSKGIFILAPNNVDIDSSIKKELESKTLFPWQSKQYLIKYYIKKIIQT